MKPQDFSQTDTRASDAGRKGGQITGELRKGATIARLCLKYLASPEGLREGFREAYDIGYRAGQQSKTRAGKGAQP